MVLFRKFVARKRTRKYIIMRVGLFIPCYVDALFPQVGVATYRLLKKLKVDVVYPEHQTCCGQPMANGGFQRMSGHLAERFEKLIMW